MNRLSTTERAAVVRALVEGNSIRATCRMTGIAKGTVTRLLVALGEACDDFQDRTLRNLPCERIQCDEIWAFSYALRRTNFHASGEYLPLVTINRAVGVLVLHGAPEFPDGLQLQHSAASSVCTARAGGHAGHRRSNRGHRPPLSMANEKSPP